jgi:hypothetical protein
MKLKPYYAGNSTTLCIKAEDSEYVYERAEVGMDGNCGYALLGPNIQEGECEFVEIVYSPSNSPGESERLAWGQALFNLRKRLGGFIPYFIKS